MPWASGSAETSRNPRRLTREIVEFAFSDLDPHLEKDYRRRLGIPARAKFAFFKELRKQVDSQESAATARNLRTAVRRTFEGCEKPLEAEFQIRSSEDVRKVIQTLLLTIPTIYETLRNYTQLPDRFFTTKDLSDVLPNLKSERIIEIIYDFKTDKAGSLFLGEKIAKLEQQRIGGGRAYQNYFIFEITNKINNIIFYLPNNFTLDEFFRDEKTATIKNNVDRWSPKRFVIPRTEHNLIDVFLTTSGSVRWYQFFISISGLVVVKEDEIIDAS